MNNSRQSGQTGIAQPPAVTAPRQRSQEQALYGGMLITRNRPGWPQMTRQPDFPNESIRRHPKGGDGGDILRFSWVFDPEGGDSYGDENARTGPGAFTCHHPVPTGGDTETIQGRAGPYAAVLTVLTLVAPVPTSLQTSTIPHRYQNGAHAGTAATVRTRNRAGCLHAAQRAPWLILEFLVEQGRAAATLMAPLGTSGGRFLADVARYPMNGPYRGFLLEVSSDGVRKVAPHRYRVPRRELPPGAGR
jgi:hypothetical protein